MKNFSVTNSSFFFASRPFLVCEGDIGEDGELDFPMDVGDFDNLLWFSENMT